MERRSTFGALIRSRLRPPTEEPALAATDELEALASELENGELEFDPACAVACMRLVSDLRRSPLLNPALPAEDLRSRVRQIRSGFEPRRLAN